MTKYKYKYNEDFFKEITEASSYFLGLLYTDGSISGTRNIVQITLNKKDGYILEKFSEQVANNKPIYNTKSGYSYFVINNRIIQNDLLNIGLTPNKTKVLKPPVNYLNNRDFWRGCMDGDGGLSYNYKSKILSLSFCGTIEMVQAFKDFCLQFIDSKTKIYLDKSVNNGNFARFALTDKNACIIGKVLYSKSEFYLKRKKEALENYEKDLEIRLKKNKDKIIKISKYSLKGVFIEEFNSRKEASESINVKDITLTKNINKINISYGFIWIPSHIFKLKKNLNLPEYFNINSRKDNINYNIIREIRELRSKGALLKDLANKYNLSMSYISCISNFKMYSNII